MVAPLPELRRFIFAPTHAAQARLFDVAPPALREKAQKANRVQ
jgi:hypothetical protein